MVAKTATPSLSPFTKAKNITPSDATVLLPIPRAVHVGGVGNLAVLMADDADPVTFTAVAAGTLLHIRPQKILATGTTATLIVGLY